MIDYQCSHRRNGRAGRCGRPATSVFVCRQEFRRRVYCGLGKAIRCSAHAAPLRQPSSTVLVSDVPYANGYTPEPLEPFEPRPWTEVYEELSVPAYLDYLAARRVGEALALAALNRER